MFPLFSSFQGNILVKTVDVKYRSIGPISKVFSTQLFCAESTDLFLKHLLPWDTVVEHLRQLEFYFPYESVSLLLLQKGNQYMESTAA